MYFNDLNKVCKEQEAGCYCCPYEMICKKLHDLKSYLKNFLAPVRLSDSEMNDLRVAISDLMWELDYNNVQLEQEVTTNE